MRKIGGVDTGMLIVADGSESLDGFEDYTLLIRLMMVELKTLLYPIYAQMMHQRYDPADSDIGNGGRSVASSSNFDEYLSASSSFSSGADERDKSSLIYDNNMNSTKNKKFLNRQGSSDSSNIFKQRDLDAQEEIRFRLYCKYFKPE